MSRITRRAGFTVLELVLVLAVIFLGLMAALAILVILLIYNKFLLIEESIRKHSESLKILRQWFYRAATESGVAISFPADEPALDVSDIRAQLARCRETNPTAYNQLHDYLNQIDDLSAFIIELRNRHHRNPTNMK